MTDDSQRPKYQYPQPSLDPAIRREAGEIPGVVEPNDFLLGEIAVRELYIRVMAETSSFSRPEGFEDWTKQQVDRAEEHKKYLAWRNSMHIQQQVAEEFGDDSPYNQGLADYADAVVELSVTDKK